jgi:hypothetical protein
VSVDVVKPHLPKTLRQAKRWQAVKDRYVADGLCHRCAAQAAWAHQDHGDTRETIHPPCVACEPIVAEFPAATPSVVWRKIVHPQARASMTPANAVEDNHDLVEASINAQFNVPAATGRNS